MLGSEAHATPMVDDIIGAPTRSVSLVLGEGRAAKRTCRRHHAQRPKRGAGGEGKSGVRARSCSFRTERKKWFSSKQNTGGYPLYAAPRGSDAQPVCAGARAGGGMGAGGGQQAASRHVCLVAERWDGTAWGARPAGGRTGAMRRIAGPRHEGRIQCVAAGGRDRGGGPPAGALWAVAEVPQARPGEPGPSSACRGVPIPPGSPRQAPARAAARGPGGSGSGRGHEMGIGRDADTAPWARPRLPAGRERGCM